MRYCPQASHRRRANAEGGGGGRLPLRRDLPGLFFADGSTIYTFSTPIRI